MNRPFVPGWPRPLLYSLGIWILLVALFALQLVLVGGFSWEAASKMALRLWLGWALLTPLTVGLALRFPLGRRSRGKNLWSIFVHGVACGGAVLVSGQVADSRWVAEALNVGRPVQKEQSERMGKVVGRPGPPEWVRETLREERSIDEKFIWDERRAGRERRGSRVIFDVLLYLCLVSGCQAILWSQRARERERLGLVLEASLTKAQLQALQMQLNPHFLFNSLNAISSLVHHNPKGADDMLGDLGALLRASLDSADEQEVSLRRELDFLNCYLEVERTRFEGRLEVVREIEEEVLDALVPTFILQPLVENAVRHGIERQLEGGRITLGARREKGRLLLTVANRSEGPKATEVSHAVSGVGLTNTHSRLAAMYQENFDFSLETSKDGCVVQLDIPLRLRGGKA